MIWEWITGLPGWVWTAVVIPLVLWVIKVCRDFGIMKRDIKELQEDKATLQRCVNEKLDALEEKIDGLDKKSTKEHNELKELVTRIETNQEWLMKERQNV